MKSIDNRITPKIKVFGCGDSGCRFAESIGAQNIPADILFYAMHTNEGALLNSPIPRKIWIDLEPGEEQVKGMKKLFAKTDIAFILSSKDSNALADLVADSALTEEKISLSISLIGRSLKPEVM